MSPTNPLMDSSNLVVSFISAMSPEIISKHNFEMISSSSPVMPTSSAAKLTLTNLCLGFLQAPVIYQSSFAHIQARSNHRQVNLCGGNFHRRLIHWLFHVWCHYAHQLFESCPPVELGPATFTGRIGTNFLSLSLIVLIGSLPEMEMGGEGRKGRRGLSFCRIQLLLLPLVARGRLDDVDELFVSVVANVLPSFLVRARTRRLRFSCSGHLLFHSRHTCILDNFLPDQSA